MCGIAGIIGRDIPSRKDKLKSMLASIRHRGPDEGGTMCDEAMCMGMNRLSIIDTEDHHPPYFNEDNTLAAIFNGEIYNFADLKASLKQCHEFKTGSDIEVFLHLYEEKGLQFLQDLNGMYATALYDSVRSKLYLIRDKCGEKPLYYTIQPGFVAFASEMKALLELIPSEFNPGCIEYRIFEFSAGRETLFKDLYLLAPGEYLEVDVETLEVSTHSYWKVWDNYIDLPDNERALEDQLSDLLVDAVNLRKQNNSHGFGCFVSGGLDSALIAFLSKPDYLFTCHYDLGADFDELDYAQQLAKHIGTELEIITPQPDDFPRTRERISWHLDTPCTWTSFSLWCLLEQSADKVKVILNGDGADEVFAGYHRYHLINHDQQIYKMESMKQYKYMMDRYYGDPVERYSRLVNRNENRFDEEANRYLSDLVTGAFAKSRDVINGMGLTDFYTTMQVLLQMGDRVCMAFSVENRSPFLDHRIVQFGFSLNEKYKIHNGRTKHLLKKVARRFIPASIADRVDKRGFSAPLNRWFGWDAAGKFQRNTYRNVVFDDWKKAFGVDSLRENHG